MTLMRNNRSVIVHSTGTACDVFDYSTGEHLVSVAGTFDDGIVAALDIMRQQACEVGQ
jgi:hypothetical protein